MAGKALDELECFAWAEPTFDSYLVATSHRLRKKPIDEFTVEDLRIMIGQKIGLQHLLARAVDELEREPLAQGDYYPGDLLASVIECGDLLRAHPELLNRILMVAERAAAELGNEDEDLRARIRMFVASSPDGTRHST